MCTRCLEIRHAEIQKPKRIEKENYHYDFIGTNENNQQNSKKIEFKKTFNDKKHKYKRGCYYLYLLKVFCSDISINHFITSESTV